MGCNKEDFIKILSNRQRNKKHKLETIFLENKKFINVPAICDSKTGKALGFSSKTLTDLYVLLDSNIQSDVIDFQKYKI